MSIKYKVVKQVFGFDKTNTVRYVARTVTSEMLPFDKVRNQVVQITGAHRGTVNLVIDGLLDVMVNNLDMGHSVRIDTDYTRGSTTGGNEGSDGEDDFVAPNA